jgi:hypothetical protein
VANVSWSIKKPLSLFARVFYSFCLLHNLCTYTIMLEALAILGHLSAASRATGPLISEPFISPSGVMITAALSSNWTQTPSTRLKDFFWRTITAWKIFFLMSGDPCLTDTVTLSPTVADG